MQKRVVYNFNAQTATESAAENSTDKAVKTSNAIGKIKRAFSGKSFKLVRFDSTPFCKFILRDRLRRLDYKSTKSRAERCR